LTGILIFIKTAVSVAVLNVPLLADLKEDVVNLIRIGDRVCVDNDQGVIEILEVYPVCTSIATGDHSARCSF